MLINFGQSYYSTPISERFFHAQYQLLKPSGMLGHGIGIAGSLLIVFGIFGYMARKRMKIFSEIGVLKYWLEFHIFLCTLGSVLVLFHTSFKFGGIISVGFWSMVIVWSSGVIGRYIYLQIPRTIEGRELSLKELNDLKDDLDIELSNKYGINYLDLNGAGFSAIKNQLISKNISKSDLSKVEHLIQKQKSLSTRIGRLDRMKKLFNYWHVAHLPFALIMLVIMIIHIAVALYFGYVWIY
jgi:hypothetical protein